MKSRPSELQLSIIFVLLFVIILNAASNIRELDFKAAVDLALQKNSKVQQYREKLNSKNCDHISSLGSYAPTVYLQSSYTRIKSPLTFDLNPIRNALISLETQDIIHDMNLQNQIKGSPVITNDSKLYSDLYSKIKNELETVIPPFIDTLKEQQYPSASLVLIQPIFTGMRVSAASKAANADKQAAYYDLERIKNEVIKETFVQCVNLIIIKEMIVIRRNVLEDMEKHLKKAQALVEQGMIARYQLLRAKVAVAEAERNLEDELNKYEIVQLAIKKNCAISDTEQILFVNTLKYTMVNDSVNIFESKAQCRQPIIHMINENMKMAKQKVIALKGVLYPQISLFGKYELFKDYLSALEPQWAFGVQANLNLFNGGKNLAAIRSAVHLTREIEQIETSAQRDISMWINKAYRDMRSAESRYLRLDTDLELAMENLHQCQSRFESGYGTSLEVIDAELVVERNKIERLAALGDYYKALAELNSAAGDAYEMINFITGDKNK